MRFFLTITLLSSGCAALGGEGRDREPDSGVVRDDAATSDAARPPNGDDDSVPATRADVANFGEPGVGFVDMETSDPLERATCFDGENNDGASGADCDDTNCQILGSCCVGSGECCAATTLSGLPTSVDFTSCDSFTECLGDAWSYLGSAASLGERGLSPEGTAEGEGGIRLDTPIDFATHSAHIDLTIAPPEDCPVGSCLESIAIGLSDDLPNEGANVTVQAAVTLLYSGARDALSVLLDGSELVRLPRGDANEATLILRPTGEIEVLVGGSSVWELDGAYEPRPMNLLIHGRTRNPGATEMRSVALESLTLTTELCDMPRAWSRRDTLPLVGRHPSIASGDAVRIAFVDLDGNLVTAREQEDGTLVVENLLDHTMVDEALGGSGGIPVKALDDPELMYIDGVWELFFTTRGDDERTWIGRAVERDGVFVPDSTPFVVDASTPTIARSEDGVRVMVARRGDSLIVLREGEAAWVELTRSLLDEVVSVIGAEFGGPSLVQHNRAWHLYVPIRHGARWSVHLFASDEMLAWRHVGPALTASSQGFDRLGVRAPDVLADGDMLRAVYLGEDGVEPRIGEARRASTAGGSF